MEMTGHDFTLGDAHGTTIDVHPTHFDPNSGIACGTATITTHPIGMASSLDASIAIGGCINTHDPNVITGLSGFGHPDVGLGVGFNW